jgi:dynein heavy chain
MKEVANTQYTACMNPTAGSFTITPRMQRHFCTFAVQMPAPEDARCVCAGAFLVLSAQG